MSHFCCFFVTFAAATEYVVECFENNKTIANKSIIKQ